MRIAAAIILYHPPADFISNMQSYYDFVDEIYVFDNSEKASAIKEQLAQFTKIRYYHDGNNHGISKRLNSASDLALQNNFDWMLTMDQDTKFAGDSMQIYLDCFKNYLQKETVAGFGPVFKYHDTPNSTDCKAEEAERIITSGMLLNLTAYKTIGGFDEALFIDLVDDEYCIAAKEKGYKIIQFKNVFITHSLGEYVYRSSIKTLYLVKKKKQVHSPLRCYYMYRNVLYVNEKYKDSDIELPRKLKKIYTDHVKLCLYYGRETLKRLKYISQAKKDFKNKRMGKKDS